MAFTLSPGFVQRADHAVIVACDGGYLPFAGVLARQLAAVPDRGFDVLIGSPQPLDLPPEWMAAGIGHVAVRDDRLEASLPLDARRSLATYMEVFLARALKGRWRRILVLDSDILLDRGDPGRLLAGNMRGRAVAAVRDNRQWRNPAKRTPDQIRQKRAAAPYFNAGVVMIDTDAWAAQDLPERCAGFARRHLAGLGRDQALVNGVLDGEWTEISPLWNWQFTWASAHLTAMADPCLIHFIGPEKPWLARSAGIVPMRYRAPYAGLPGAAGDLTRRAWPDRGRLARALLRQWRASGPMLTYLARFADEYALIDPR
ncbi:glycosyltransferase family 8 protein [Paracoccus contaminans]|uniref:Glycosyltransferase n=1 Tax=Paracoccus contaminans TaxID=1945662 RepID=A0A1W6CU46_9RHOB|nr:glycosyltransferase [Paracoccus contaminans]ARJ68371.1 hypothetical protein B0A89_00585 [Paracoccus contaminans]